MWHAFTESRQAFVERHTVRLLVLRFHRFFHLVDHMLVDTRRRLLVSTMRFVHRVFKRSFEQAEDEADIEERTTALERVLLALLVASIPSLSNSYFFSSPCSRFLCLWCYQDFLREPSAKKGCMGSRESSLPSFRL